MSENNHPHKKAIDNMGIHQMISLIDESKSTYVKENLSTHLHTSQIKLLKEAKKHSKPHHKRIRKLQYKQLLEKPEEMDSLFELHKKLYIKKYEKLQKKGLVTVDTECEDLPYDVTLTQEGKDILQEIDDLEVKWKDVVFENVEGAEELFDSLRQVSHNALPINYNHKKQLKFVF